MPCLMLPSAEASIRVTWCAPSSHHVKPSKCAQVTFLTAAARYLGFLGLYKCAVAVLLESDPQLLLRIHHDGAVPSDRFTDRLA